MSSILKPVLGSQLQLGHSLACGLVGYWLLNEGSGNKVFDLSGNGNTGNLVADTHFVPGKFGSCLSFDGTDDRVNCGNNTYLGTGGKWTISLLAKQFALTNGKGIIAKYYTTGNNRSFYFYTSSAGAQIFCRLSSDGSNNITVTSPLNAGFLVANTWYHFTWVFNGVNIAFYQDGVLIGSPQASSVASVYPGIAPLEIGSGYNSGITFNGLIDNVLIFNRALSASEIALLYQEPFCMFERDPIELWSAATLGAAPPVGMAGAMTTNTGYWGW